MFTFTMIDEISGTLAQCFVCIMVGIYKKKTLTVPAFLIITEI